MKSLDEILEKLAEKYKIEKSNSGHNEFVDENGKASKLTTKNLIRLIETAKIKYEPNNAG